MSVPQYTYTDYSKLVHAIDNTPTAHNVWADITSTIRSYIFNGKTEYKELDVIPPKHEILSMVMRQPYKMYIYDTPFEDLPLEMNNTYQWVETIVKWRLQIGK